MKISVTVTGINDDAGRRVLDKLGRALSRNGEANRAGANRERNNNGRIDGRRANSDSGKAGETK